MKIYFRILRIVWLVVFCASLAGGVQAAPQDVTMTVTTLEDEYQVDGDCSLREAMHAANYNEAYDQCPTGDSIGMDTIVFANGGTIVLGMYLPAYNAGPMTIDGGSQVAVSGNNATNILEVESEADLTLRNLTFTLGYSSENSIGGALTSSGGTITIDNCDFLDNNAYNGGAIYNLDGSMTISNSHFQDNDASSLGGAIHNTAVNLTINSSSFNNNSSMYHGGAIMNWVKLEINGCTFKDNVTLHGGGAILSINYLHVVNTTFDGNSAWGSGGAIACTSDSSLDCQILDSSFVNNIAFEDGGAIYNGNSSGEMSVNGVWFSGNAALGNGGAVCLDSSIPYYPINISFTNTTFYDNAATNGGALFLGDITASISDSLFVQNEADYGGGINNQAIDFNNSGLTIERTTLWENNSLQGGAIYNENAHLMMTNDTLTSNTADSGGGAYNTAGGLVEILNSTLAHNSAGQSDQLFNDAGAAIYTANSIYAYGVAGYNCLGTITDNGHNIDDSNTCGFSPANGSLPDTDPILGPLQDNGGPGTPGYGTLTFALYYPSPAINHADASQCPGIDQRDYVRRSGYCDIGAFEAQPYAFYVNSGDYQSTDINTYFPEPLVMEAQDYYGNGLAGVGVTFSGPDAGASIANNHTTLTTGVDGFASLSALANGIPGGWYEVDALHTLSSTYTTFHLTNLALPGWTMWTFLPVLRK